MDEELSQSRLAMWRAVIAMIHADHVVKPHEVAFILENLQPLRMTDGQNAVLMGDLKVPQDPIRMFREITRGRDREDFFRFAKSVSWADGEFHEGERKVLDEILKEMHATGDAGDEAIDENVAIEVRDPAGRSVFKGLRQLFGD